MWHIICLFSPISNSCSPPAPLFSFLLLSLYECSCFCFLPPWLLLIVLAAANGLRCCSSSFLFAPLAFFLLQLLLSSPLAATVAFIPLAYCSWFLPLWLLLNRLLAPLATQNPIPLAAFLLLLFLPSSSSCSYISLCLTWCPSYFRSWTPLLSCTPSLPCRGKFEKSAEIWSVSTKILE
jgi:hypothetical protein